MQITTGRITYKDLTIQSTHTKMFYYIQSVALISHRLRTLLFICIQAPHYNTFLTPNT